MYTSMQQHLWAHSQIRVHSGKTQVWNREGAKPDMCNMLKRIARATNPDARVWRGSGDGKAQVHQNHFQKNFLQNPLSSKCHFHQKPLSSEHFLSEGPTTRAKTFLSVCVKASRAQGPRRLHTNMVYAHLWVPAEGPKVGVLVLGFRF